MPKADDALTTSPNPTPTRRSILAGGARVAGAAIAGMAAIPSLQALAAIPVQPLPVNENAQKNLAEVRRLIAALIRIDGRIGEAERAPRGRARRSSKANTGASIATSQTPNELEGEPPRCWVDIVMRAEIVGYEFLNGEPRADWDASGGARSRAFPFGTGEGSLAFAVLWLGDRGALEDPKAGRLTPMDTEVLLVPACRGVRLPTGAGRGWREALRRVSRRPLAQHAQRLRRRTSPPLPLSRALGAPGKPWRR